MANTLVQFRADENERVRAALICEQLGFDLPTYLRICIRRLNQENGVPFNMKLDDTENSRALAALKAASRIAKENGTDGMMLEEINAEIAEARK